MAVSYHMGARNKSESSARASSVLNTPNWAMFPASTHYHFLIISFKFANLYLFSLLLMLEDLFRVCFASDCSQHQGEDNDLLFPLIFPALPGHGLCSANLSTKTFTFPWVEAPSPSFALDGRNSDSDKVNIKDLEDIKIRSSLTCNEASKRVWDF